MRRIASAITERLVIAVPYAWLLVLFLVPFFIVLKISLSETAIAMPPYDPAFSFAHGFAGFWAQVKKLGFDNYVWLTQDDLYLLSYLSSVKIAAISTLLTLLFGYPIAYGIARAPSTIRPTLLMMVILPFWTSFLIRVYAWIGILKPEGLLNQLLLSLHVIDAPLIIINTTKAVYIGIVYSCRSIRRWRRWTIRSSRRRKISAVRPSRPSGRSPSACRCRGSSPVACSSSSRRSASSSSPTCSAARRP
jgi:putrescine transport system permease protein